MRDSGLIKGEAHYYGAIFFGYRKYHRHVFFCAVHGVDYRPSVARPYAGFYSLWVGAVYLKRKGGHALHFLYDARNDSGFIYLRKPRVYVEYIGSLFRLIDCFADYIFHIAVSESFLKPFLSSRIYTLAYHGDHSIEDDGPCR